MYFAASPNVSPSCVNAHNCKHITYLDKAPLPSGNRSFREFLVHGAVALVTAEIRRHHVRPRPRLLMFFN